MTEPPRISAAVQDLLARLDRPIRAWSLIVTIFGDVVVPRGGSLWLGTLLPIMNAAGIAAGVVRTATSRLVDDGWLERDKAGRNSFYRLSANARDESERAAARIYAADDVHAAADWTLAITQAPSIVDRARQRDGLLKRGAGQLATDVFILPLQVPAPITGDAAAIMLRVSPRDAADARALARQAWPLDDIAAAYARYNAIFAPTAGSLAAATGLSDLDALVLRLLVVHELRRIALRDPGLPRACLGPDWPGVPARQVAATIWHATLAPSERWLDRHGRTLAGELPKPSLNLRDRFIAAPA